MNEEEIFKMTIDFAVLKRAWDKTVKGIFLIVLIFSQLSSAEKTVTKIWIKAPQMPFKEFEAHIEAFGFPQVSYAQNLLIQKRKEAKSFQLKEKLIVAQELYLSGEGESAMKAFGQITDLALSADWDEEDRRIILYSFLRAAQNEEDWEKRKAILLSAISFALFKISNANYPDQDLFPPPLMEEIRLIQTKATFLLVDWKNIFPDHEIILINGEQVKKDKKIKIPQTFYRVSAFSSSHLPWSQNLNLSELLTRKIKTKSLTKGPCGKFQIKLNLKDESTQVLPFSNCPRPLTLRFEQNKSITKNKKQGQDKKLFAKKASIKNNNLDRLENLANSYPPDTSLLNSEALLNGLGDSSLEQQERFSNIPPWLIMSAGITAFILVISLSQKNQKTKGDYVY